MRSLLAGRDVREGMEMLDAHEQGWERARVSAPRSSEALDASGLRGRGGGAFPVATKWRSVASGSSRSRAVLISGAEGEPLSPQGPRAHGQPPAPGARRRGDRSGDAGRRRRRDLRRPGRTPVPASRCGARCWSGPPGSGSGRGSWWRRPAMWPGRRARRCTASTRARLYRRTRLPGPSRAASPAAPRWCRTSRRWRTWH